MDEQNLDYAAIHSRVEKGVQRRKSLYRLIFFGTHLFFFLVAMAVVWGTLLIDGSLRATLFGNPAGIAVVVVPTVLWAIMILCHIASLYTESSAGEQGIREQLLMREVGQDILRRGRLDTELAEKPKRQAAALSDDGELIPVDEDELTEQNDYVARTTSSSKS